MNSNRMLLNKEVNSETIMEKFGTNLQYQEVSPTILQTSLTVFGQ